jgi:hypothetical protein
MASLNISRFNQQGMSTWKIGPTFSYVVLAVYKVVLFCSHFPGNRGWSLPRVWSRRPVWEQRGIRVVQVKNVPHKRIYRLSLAVPFSIVFSVKIFWSVALPPVVYITSHSSPSQCFICGGLMRTHQKGKSLCTELCSFVKLTHLASWHERSVQLI